MWITYYIRLVPVIPSGTGISKIFNVVGAISDRRPDGVTDDKSGTSSKGGFFLKSSPIIKKGTGKAECFCL